MAVDTLDSSNAPAIGPAEAQSGGGSSTVPCPRSCSFSFDGIDWEDASSPEHGGVAVGPLVCEPGWDFYDVLPYNSVSAQRSDDVAPMVLRIRRATPIRLVRVYSEWPTTQAPLGATLRPEGVAMTSVTLPAHAAQLPRILVAVCPPVAALGKGATRVSVTTGVSAVADLQKRLRAGVGARFDSEIIGKDVGPAGYKRPVAPRTAWSNGVGHVSTGGAVTSNTSPTGASGGVQSALAPSSPSSTCGHVSTRAMDSTITASPRSRGRAPRGWDPHSLHGHAHAPRQSQNSANTGLRGGLLNGAEPATADEKLRSELRALRAELEEQRRAKDIAEAEALFMNSQAAELREERESLRSKLRSAERATMASEMQVRALQSEVAEAKRESQRATRQPRQGRIGLGAPQNLEDVVSALVTMELRQLSSCSAQERAAAKKRLLLRWHPDKNVTASGGCADLATRITQEMQSRPEWNF